MFSISAFDRLPAVDQHKSQTAGPVICITCLQQLLLLQGSTAHSHTNPSLQLPEATPYCCTLRGSLLPHALGSRGQAQGISSHYVQVAQPTKVTQLQTGATGQSTSHTLGQPAAYCQPPNPGACADRKLSCQRQQKSPGGHYRCGAYGQRNPSLPLVTSLPPIVRNSTYPARPDRSRSLMPGPEPQPQPHSWARSDHRVARKARIPQRLEPRPSAPLRLWLLVLLPRAPLCPGCGLLLVVPGMAATGVAVGSCSWSGWWRRAGLAGCWPGWWCGLPGCRGWRWLGACVRSGEGSWSGGVRAGHSTSSTWQQQAACFVGWKSSGGAESTT